MIIKQCIICKKSFEVFPYRENIARFCSIKCSDIFKIGKKHSPEHIEKMRIGIKNNLPRTAFKKGQRKSPKTEFKKGQAPWNKGKKMPEKTNEGNSNWKGDNVGYHGLHRWIHRHKGKPKICETCGSTKNLQWANKDHKYRRELSDYISLCSSCHKQFDLIRKNVSLPNRNKVDGRFILNKS